MPRIKPLVRPTRDSLQDQCQLLLSGGLFVHENTDGNGQGLGAHVACHIQDQRLKAHDDWELGHDGFKKGRRLRIRRGP